MNNLLHCLAAAVLLGLPLPSTVRGAELTKDGHYQIRYLTEMRVLGLDIYKGLKPKQKDALAPEPISVETDVSPAIKLAEFDEDNNHLGFVFVTVGFIDLVNNVAHAKAIDKVVKKGYFEKYVLSLAEESGEKELKELPDLENPKFWGELVENEHRSNLRQMIGTAVSIKLAHHCLGHYKKYAKQLEDPSGKRTPINNLMTPAEWQDAMKLGTRIALEGGCGIEGILALFEAIDKMPKRPEWTSYFLPAKVNVKSVASEMKKIEKKFYAGEE